MTVDIKCCYEVVKHANRRSRLRRSRLLIFCSIVVNVCLCVFVFHHIFFKTATNSSWKPSEMENIPAGKTPTYNRQRTYGIGKNLSRNTGVVSRRASFNNSGSAAHLPSTSIQNDQFDIRDFDTFGRFVGDLELPAWPDAHHADRIAYQNDLINVYANATSNRKRKMKTILHVGYGDLVMGQTDFKDCPVPECLLTNDSLHMSRSADAVHMTGISYWQLRRKFLPKPSHQIWIAEHWESPVHDVIDTAAVKDLINWTVSYRMDSTVPVSYGRFYPIVGGASTPASIVTTRNYSAEKTKKVAWFVSNCNAKNFRQRYAEELSKFIQVDVYGNCGRLTCPRSDGKSCFEMLSRDYKFYLAFENSNCNDYITEKLTYNGLSHDILPIVMGARREDYASFAPTHSYIHVDDFTGPQQLADYLHLLDRNDTLYNEYFTWKGSWMNMILNQNRWCRLCALLHWRDDVDYVSWYDDYRVWWNTACNRSPTLPWFQRNAAPTGTIFRTLYFVLTVCMSALTRAFT